MKIAYYGYGNVRRPRGTLHDVKGKPILKKEELLLYEDHDAACLVYRTRLGGWVRLLGTLAFPDIGTGSLYRTSDRIIYLRRPPVEQYSSGAARWVSRSEGFMDEARRWETKGLREGFSIDMEEVRKLRRRGRRGIWMRVGYRGSNYVVVLRPSLMPFI